jgi:uncharacterized protein
MKRAIIIHCWSGNPEYCWYPKTKQELEAHDFTVQVPTMPETDAPELRKWLPELVEAAGEPNEQLYLIGHSIGTVAIMRYLESLPAQVSIGGVVLVAGFTESLGFRELENFFETKLDFRKIKSKAKQFVLINSDDDPFVPIQYGHRLAEELEGKLIIKHAMGHFSGAVDDEASCTSLPDVASSITVMTSAP